MFLGQLGNRLHFRCRWCGGDYSTRADDEADPYCPYCKTGDDDLHDLDEAYLDSLETLSR